jgi:hydroxypyruvate reductase
MPPSSHAARAASSKWCAGAESPGGALATPRERQPFGETRNFAGARLSSSGDPRRALLLNLLKAALEAVDGRRCVRDSLRASMAPAGAPQVWVAAVGKAAPAMALGAHEALGNRIARTLVITRAGHAPAELLALPGAEIIASAHPVPDQRSLAAGARLLAWVEALPPVVEPLLLVSGGASSLVVVLGVGLTLADL